MGEESKINLLTTNPTFNAMRKTVIGLNSKFSSSNISAKNLPDYFLLFSFTPPIKTTFIQNQAGLKSSYFQMLACGTMFDKTGKVVFSKCVDDKTEPRASVQTFGAADGDITGILVKNLIEKIAMQINSKIEFKEYEFKIKKIENNDIILEDKDGILSEGNQITIFKKNKSLSGAEYLLPAFLYRVVSTSNGTAQCTFDYPYSDDIEKPTKSNVAKSSMIVAAGGSNFYKVDTSNLVLTDSEVKIRHLDKFLVPIIGSGFKKPLTLDNSVIEKKMDAVNSTLMFKDKLIIPPNTSGLEVLPYYRVNLKKQKVVGYSKINKYKLLVGIKVSDKGKIVNNKSVEKEIEMVLPTRNEQPVLQIELLKVIYPTLQQLAETLK